jgi:hypothetical protein
MHHVIQQQWIELYQDWKGGPCDGVYTHKFRHNLLNNKFIFNVDHMALL